MRELLIKWLREGQELKTGEELYLPADSVQNQRDMYTALRAELNVLRKIDPENAAKLRVFCEFKSGQYWVVIKKISVTPLTAFKKDTNGTVSRVQITNERTENRIKELKEVLC